MTHELIYTSARKGLKPGSHGFCTVATTAGIPRKLIESLESLSSYRHVFQPGAAENPPVYSHLRLNLGGDRYQLLSYIADAGSDYSGRSNTLAHHVAIELSEQVPAGPAWLMRQNGCFTTAWSGQPRILNAERRLPKGRPPNQPCTIWQQVTGDAGWAAVLANNTDDHANIIVEPGMPTLPLVVEALNLLAPDARWQTTFSTYFTKLPPGIQCQWRFLLSGTPEAEQAINSGQVLLDLTNISGSPPPSAVAEMARSGNGSPAASPAFHDEEDEWNSAPGPSPSSNATSRPPRTPDMYAHDAEAPNAAPIAAPLEEAEYGIADDANRSGPPTLDRNRGQQRKSKLPGSSNKSNIAVAIWIFVAISLLAFGILAAVIAPKLFATKPPIIENDPDPNPNKTIIRNNTQPIDVPPKVTPGRPANPPQDPDSPERRRTKAVRELTEFARSHRKIEDTINNLRNYLEQDVWGKWLDRYQSEDVPGQYQLVRSLQGELSRLDPAWKFNLPDQDIVLDLEEEHPEAFKTFFSLVNARAAKQQLEAFMTQQEPRFATWNAFKSGDPKHMEIGLPRNATIELARLDLLDPKQLDLTQVVRGREVLPSGHYDVARHNRTTDTKLATWMITFIRNDLNAPIAQCWLESIDGEYVLMFAWEAPFPTAGEQLRLCGLNLAVHPVAGKKVQKKMVLLHAAAPILVTEFNPLEIPLAQVNTSLPSRVFDAPLIMSLTMNNESVKIPLATSTQQPKSRVGSIRLADNDDASGGESIVIILRDVSKQAGAEREISLSIFVADLTNSVASDRDPGRSLERLQAITSDRLQSATIAMNRLNNSAPEYERLRLLISQKRESILLPYANNSNEEVVSDNIVERIKTFVAQPATAWKDISSDMNLKVALTLMADSIHVTKLRNLRTKIDKVRADGNQKEVKELVRSVEVTYSDLITAFSEKHADLFKSLADFDSHVKKRIRLGREMEEDRAASSPTRIQRLTRMKQWLGQLAESGAFEGSVQQDLGNRIPPLDVLRIKAVSKKSTESNANAPAP